MTAPRFALTKIKTFEGRNGPGLNAQITMDGKAVADVLDSGDGGMMSIDFFSAASGGQRTYGNPAAEAALVAHLRAEYAAAGGDGGYKARMQALGLWVEGSELSSRSDHDVIEEWINRTVDEVKTIASYKRMAKSATLFRLAEDKSTAYRKVKAPLSDPRVLPHLREKYGASLVWVFDPENPSLTGLPS